jgi:hypothetical protein
MCGCNGLLLGPGDVEAERSFASVRAAGTGCRIIQVDLGELNLWYTPILRSDQGWSGLPVLKTYSRL